MNRLDLVRVLRPHQWYKNLVVFVALVFSNNVGRADLWRPALLTFVAFCLLSGAAYAWNDVVDAPLDRLHPKKKRRPVARRTVSAATAILWGGVAAALGLALLWPINAPTLLLGLAFLALQAVYNVLFKHQVIWDVLVIGVGFVLRALAGTTAIDVGPPTAWLILCTFLFALFLALAKRRHELLLLNHKGSPRATRPILAEYSVAILEQMTNIVATLLLASYFLYTFFGTTPWMMFTIPFAVYGVLRYLYLVHRRDLGDEPELIFRDPPTVLNAAAWILVVLLVLQGVPQSFLGWLEGL